MLALIRREEDVGKVSDFSRHIYMGYEPGLIMYKLFILNSPEGIKEGIKREFK